MRHHRHYGCGPRGRIQFNIPEGLFAMGGRGGRGSWGPFSFDFGGGHEGWSADGPRRRRRSHLSAGDLRLLVLFLIADKPRHGYDVIKAVETLSGGQYVPSPGVIYPTLTMLQDLGHIEEVPEEGSRKTYQATDEGRAWLEEQAEAMQDLMLRLDGLGDGSQRGGKNPHLGRAVGNLMTALRNRVSNEGWDEELVHEITAILDDAAQRIERLK
ncbi:PadR family transcriptional regulator [Sphingomonas sp.]|uniref:PadR family transcriptional regulator n=1 Tax=Sphingomonas sp. TaxID=28214 RepID=UPI0025D7C97D|nr:PadR family transcriptional regulator [Sphingomonas sp.]MBV9527825.1 PadR family transcriptional regulator [Sphingomonas sp.]